MTYSTSYYHLTNLRFQEINKYVCKYVYIKFIMGYRTNFVDRFRLWTAQLTKPEIGDPYAANFHTINPGIMVDAPLHRHP
jgi:hypothetical protein